MVNGHVVASRVAHLLMATWLRTTLLRAMRASRLASHLMLGVVILLLSTLGHAISKETSKDGPQKVPQEALQKIPLELSNGMIRFEIERENYFDALVLMSETDKTRRPIDYASALNGFHMDTDVKPLLDKATAKGKELTPIDLFRIGRTQYLSDNCIPALKAFKNLRNKIPVEEKQEWAFYRANCFIKLGSNKRAAQAINDLLSGLWISHAYYNLAIAYGEASTNKTKALVALRVAVSLNEGENKLEQELNDRINYAAGQFYLDSNKPKLAGDFFKKVYLESASAPQALYLNGVSHLETNDFRAATQSWFSVKKYPLIHSGVAEALLAIPYAYEGSGYVSQALEAYVEASDSFEKELAAIDKIASLLDKYGFVKVLIEETELEGLEWFLAKDVAKHTQKAAYYTYLISDSEIHDTVELLYEFIMMEEGLNLWNTQLAVYGKSLAGKKKGFKKQSKKLNIKKLNKRVSRIKGKSDKLSSAIKPRTLTALQDDLDAARARIKSLVLKVEVGEKDISSQQKVRTALAKRLKKQKKSLAAFQKTLDESITTLALARLAKLREKMEGNFEKAEQGLVHILEAVAESKHPKANRLNGRYQ